MEEVDRVRELGSSAHPTCETFIRKLRVVIILAVVVCEYCSETKGQEFVQIAVQAMPVDQGGYTAWLESLVDVSVLSMSVSQERYTGWLGSVVDVSVLPILKFERHHHFDNDMAPSATQHRRTHNLLLLNNLLNQQSAVSPFTLVLDSLEQTAGPLLTEYIRRASDAKIRTVFVSFETLKSPHGVDSFVQAWSQPLSDWQSQIANETAPSQQRRNLLIIDSLNLAASSTSTLPALLSSFITPTTSLLAVYHTDISESPSASAYGPSMLSLCSYLATTVITVHSLHHVLASKAAKDRSVVEPSFGLDEQTNGVLQGLGANSTKETVLELEHRRKSGRGVREWLVLAEDMTNDPRRRICLLEDFPGYKSEPVTSDETGDTGLSTFELGLTDKQRRDREGVVLPYFDAQKGSNEGGRILYDMGSEDDFDEEEDEI